MKAKNKMLMSLLVTIGLTILLSLPIKNLYAAAVWTAAASTCEVDEGSRNNYATTGAKFHHRTGTGSIFGRLNVTNPMDDGSSPPWNGMRVTYLDPVGAGNQVVVTLIRVNDANTSETIATFNSNDFGAGAAVQSQVVNFIHTFNFESWAYYVLLQVSRTVAGAANNPGVFRVEIGSTGD